MGNLDNQLPVIRGFFDKLESSITPVLPRNVSLGKLKEIVMTEVRRTPKLANCNPVSLIGAATQCCQLGLLPDKNLGQGYLIPFGKEVELVIGYKGMIRLAVESGKVSHIDAYAVYQGDEFYYQYGSDPKLTHVPCSFGNRGEITHFYAIATMIGGLKQWSVMTLEEVKIIQANSPSAKADKSPWKTPIGFPEMGKKSAIRKLFKYMAISPNMDRAVALDEMAESEEVSQKNAAVINGEAVVIDDGAVAAQGETTAERVKNQLKKKAGKEPHEAQLDDDPLPDMIEGEE